MKISKASPEMSKASAEDDSAVQELLRICRDKIDEEDPSKALAALLHAVRISHPAGESAIFEILDQARERAQHEDEMKFGEDSAMGAHGDNQTLRNLQCLSESLVRDTNTILYEQGTEHILAEAFEDGSSVICSKCNSLIPRERREQHYKYWCEANDDLEIKELI